MSKTKQNIMFDTNVYNCLIDNPDYSNIVDTIKKIKDKIELWITTVQIGELNDTKDVDRRRRLFTLCIELSPKLAPTSSVIGYMVLGQSFLGGNDKLYKGKKGRKIHDPMIEESSLFLNNCLLVTNDSDFGKTNVKFMTFNEFIEYCNNLLKN